MITFFRKSDDLTTPLTLYAVQKHTHTGTNGTTSPNGCYNEAYSNYEVTGSTTVNKWRCTVCGAEGWGAPYIGDTQHGNMWTVIDSRTENSYGYRTRYRCTKTDKIG